MSTTAKASFDTSIVIPEKKNPEADAASPASTKSCESKSVVSNKKVKGHGDVAAACLKLKRMQREAASNGDFKDIDSFMRHGVQKAFDKVVATGKIASGAHLEAVRKERKALEKDMKENYLSKKSLREFLTTEGLIE
jgi:hypothetical protein